MLRGVIGGLLELDTVMTSRRRRHDEAVCHQRAWNSITALNHDEGMMQQVSPATPSPHILKGKRRYGAMRSARGLYYTDTGGTGEPILFIHGWGASTRYFDWVIERLPDLRCIAVDLPGFGRSAGLAADIPCTIPALVGAVHGLVVDLGVRPVICGHSMGGMVAQEFALRYPEDLGGLILLATSPDPARERRWRFLVPLSPLIYPFGFRPCMRWFARRYAMNASRASPEAIALIGDIAVRNGKRRLRACIRGMRCWSALDRLGRIAVPTLVIHGDADWMIDIAAMDLLVGGIPGARGEVIEGVGHSPTLEAPDRTAELIGGFVEDIMGA